MTLHSQRLTRVLPYDPDELFKLVGDVESYPQFVPWVSALRTWNRREPEPGVTVLDAEARVGFAIIRETFATRVRRNANDRSIEVGLLYGPFRQLRNHWTFLPTPGGTRIEFEIDFEFKSRMLDALLAANMSHAAEKVVNCFDARAETLLGPGATQSPDAVQDPSTPQDA